jgi:hypothetical protein
MAVSEFHVVFSQETAGLGLDGVVKEFSKAEAEALNPALTEKCVLRGPVMNAKYVVVEAETAGMAAKFVKVALSGAGGQPISKFPTVKTTEWKEESPQ